MIHTYSAKDGFQLEEITFGNGVPLVLEKPQAPPSPQEPFGPEVRELRAVEPTTWEPVVSVEPAVEPVLETPALAAVAGPAPLAAVPEPAPVLAASVPEPAPAAETRCEQRFEDKEDDVVAHVAEAIAVGLSRIRNNTIRELEKRRVAELGMLSATVAEQRQRLDTTVGELAEVKHRIGGLLDVVSAQVSAACANTHKYEEMAQGIAALREAGARQESAIAAVTGRLDEVAGRVETQQQELTSLRPALLELSPRVAAVVERLDRGLDANDRLPRRRLNGPQLPDLRTERLLR